MKPLLSFIQKINSAIASIEKAMLMLILSAIIIVLLVQIVLRNVSNQGIFAADLIVRHLILWIALLGASLTTYYRSHIRIDVVNRFVSEHVRKWLIVISDCIACAVCVWLTQAGYVFLRDEYQYGGDLAGLFPQWIILIVIPVWFGIIAARFAIRAIEALILRGAQ